MGCANPDVVVIGTGRSGTSTVARILHERLGVCMGHDFIASHRRCYIDGVNVAQPLGSYESKSVMRTTKSILASSGTADTARMWLDSFENMHASCEARRKGVKNNHFYLMTTEQIAAICPSLIVRTYRPQRATVDSLLRWRGWRKGKGTREYWDDYYEQRERAMSMVGAELDIPFATVGFTERLSDSTIVDLLNPAIKALER